MTDPAYDFALDPFQIRAIEALEQGDSVLVSAPTGSGKTVVAEHAVALALANGTKVFYTTPIKALSNQKYHDLGRRHGSDNVGLLTGDNAINGDAPVVVMTTEVLRNMIYARSGALEGLQFVVLDEVHYLQDAYRGPVWEEVMIHLPHEVRLVCLSATVSNSDELADWITTVRGPTTSVVEHKRPIELENIFAVGDRSAERLVMLPTLVDGLPNPRGSQYDAEPVDRSRGGGSRGRGRRAFTTPRRLEIIDALDDAELLPAIFFIFSRAGCDDAVKSCVDTGIRLTTAEERDEIRAIAELHVRSLSDGDLALLGYGRWLVGLESGFAAHHAGMVPPFKEAVEACFVRGLVKVVFATETLALGINMPARTVIIDKLTKFTGEGHEFLTPAQYTQLTGRAGRRGMDEHGTAVVLWSPFVPFGEVAALAASRSFRLTSSFRPTYNMAANLVRRYSASEAHHLLNLSLAQYQADQTVVRLEARLSKRRQYLDEVRATAACELGDIDEYRALLDQHQPKRDTVPSVEAEVEAALRALKPGDVVELHGGKSAGRVAVLSVATRKAGTVRLRAITVGRRILTLGATNFTEPPTVLAQIELPSPFTPNSTAFQRATARRLADLTPESGDDGRDEAAAGRGGGSGGVPTTAADHPVDRCPDRAEHLRAAKQGDRVQREIKDLTKQVRGHTETLARRFDQVLQLLESWHYLDGWKLTPRGNQLVRIYHEADLLLAEGLHGRVFDDLDPASLAALVSCLTYEHRSKNPAPPPRFPTSGVRDGFNRLDELARSLNRDESAAGLPNTRRPDPGFVALAHGWAAGDDLDQILVDEDVSGGDFVRNIRQLIDLLRQVGDAATRSETRDAARVAADRLFRGVVSASSAVEADEADEDEAVDDGVDEGIDDDVPVDPEDVAEPHLDEHRGDRDDQEG